MLFGKNVAVNYVSQMYVTLANVIAVPIIIGMAGSEVYGLIAFFAVMQIVFQVLELGFASTATRITAGFRGGNVDRDKYSLTIRFLDACFWFGGFVGAVVVYTSAEYICEQWLGIENLSYQDAVLSVQIMAIAVSLRFISCFYRGVVSGFEHFVWLSCFNIFSSTSRSFLVLIPLWLLEHAAVSYFVFQSLVAFVELVVLKRKVKCIVPSMRIKSLRVKQNLLDTRMVEFSLSMAFTSVVSISIYNADKIVLSGFLSLKDYGFFSIAVLAASVVTLAAAPITAVFLPRLTRVMSQSREKSIELYRSISQLVFVVVFPLSLLIMFFSEQVLYLWLGVSDYAASQVLKYYAIGNVLNVIAGFPFLFQYAAGNIRYHVLGSSVFCLIYLLLLAVLVSDSGALGASYAWCIVNALYLLFYVPVAHSKLVQGLNREWFLKDVAPIFIPTLVVIVTCFSFSELYLSENRLLLAVALCVIGMVSITTSCFGSSYLRCKIIRFIDDFFKKRLI